MTLTFMKPETVSCLFFLHGVPDVHTETNPAEFMKQIYSALCVHMEIGRCSCRVLTVPQQDKPLEI